MIDFELDQFLISKIINLLPAPVSKQGNNYIFRCPVCGDSKKDKNKRRGVFYTAYPANFYCFNCDTSLTAFKFLKFLSNTDFKTIITEYNREKLNLLNSNSDIKNTDFDIVDLQKPVNEYPEISDLQTEQIEYLEKRFITKLDFFDTLYFKNAVFKKDKYVFIPWIKHNQIILYQLHNYQHIKGIPKYMFQKNAERIVYGLNRIDPLFKYIICFEGVFDSLFVKNGVALGGRKLMNTQLNEIQNSFPTHKIVLSMDNDAAGLSSLHKSIAKHDFLYFLWFTNKKFKKYNFKDVNDYVVQSQNISVFNDQTFLENNIFSSIEAKYELLKFKE